MSVANASPKDVVILAARRTPQGRLLGQLSGIDAPHLGATAIRAALVDSGVKVTDIDHVIMGQVVQADCGQNPARQAAVHAGLPMSTPTLTVNSVCLSGLRAVIEGSRMLRLGETQVVVAGGQESMSNAPHLLRGIRSGVTYGSVQTLDALERDALTDAFDHASMGTSTDEHNESLGISRQQQDEVAAMSHQRAAAAWESGVFSPEIAAVEVPQRKGEPLIIDRDQGIRPESTVESLAKLRPAFIKGGSVTAGNSSPISDGAAAVVLTTRAWAEKNNLEYLAVIGAAGHVAGPDTTLHSQPARAINAAVDRASGDWTVADLDFIEINEAFGAVAVKSLEELGYPLEQTNIHGGAIALGHPVGASGARLVVHAAHELSRRGTGRSAVALCGGGGQGDALLLWR
ncbi:acetyl-CoA C-acetyltransferase [Corynebacterium sp. A21]|uniref:acetyl-CoA C-acetyltransferase n=1 Tax=Corynebacterium sp. A21 TaxID=3457318 RepID=UPI003FD6A30A